MDKNLGSKKVYKLFLGLVKFTPIALLLINILGITCNYFLVSIPILAFLGGTSLPFLVILYLIASVFKYCYLYKMPLYYLTGMDALIMFSKLVLPIVDLYRIIFITFGIFMIVYIAYAYLTRNNPNRKIDYIKDFCERYCNC